MFNVLSLFDGASCAQMALHRAGIHYDNYYASEIKDHAIKLTQAMYPETIQLGDVTKIDWKTLPKIDLMFFGSPCQGLSVSGKRKGLDDYRSKLFYNAVEALNVLKPDWFLMENVGIVVKNAADEISSHLGVRPVKINSNLVSAQSRERNYWCNWRVLEPLDKGIILEDIRDIHEDEKDYAYRFREYDKKPKDRRGMIRIGDIGTTGEAFRVYSSRGKSRTLKALSNSYGNTGLYKFNDGKVRQLTPLETCRLQTYDESCFDKVDLPGKLWLELFGDGFTVDVIVEILKCNRKLNMPLPR